MEIDQFIAENIGAWQRLDHLASKGRRRHSSLEPAESDELLSLYDTVSAHLSVARTHFDDQVLNDALSQLLGFARGLIYRPEPRRRNALWVFLAVIFPAAVWRTKGFILLAALLTIVPATAMGVWLTGSDEVRNATISPETQRLVAEHQFEDYYSSNPAQAWSFELFTHNSEVAALSFAAGTVFVVGAWALLFQNAINIANNAAVMYAAGKSDLFWTLIIPHGLLELSAVFLAAGAGMAIGWAVIAPGPRSRRDAIAETGQRSVIVMLGAMLCLVVAGFTEAFVTPSDIPASLRVGIGIVWFVGLLVWTLGVGSQAVANGATGTFSDLTDPDEAEALAQLAAARERISEVRAAST